MSDHDAAWDKFMQYIETVRVRIGDRYVPIALVCLEAIARDDGATDVLPDKDGIVVWPASFRNQCRDKRERSEDRAAIRALLHEYEICLGHRTALREHSDHSEAIQRAQDAKG